MSARSIRRTASVVLGASLLVLLTSGAIQASGDGPTLIDDRDEPIVVFTGWLNVPADVTVDDAVIFDGDATIDGVVNGTALATNGDVIVRGTVHGDVVSLNGRAIVEDGAEVGGSVTSKLAPQISPSATTGPVSQNQFNLDFVLVGRVAFWITASVASLLFGLLLILFAPRAAEAAARTGRRRVGPSLGWGVLLFLGIPIVGAITLVTVVGALFGVAILTGMVLLYLVAYAAGVLAFGRLLLREPRNAALAFLLGWVIVRVLALVPVVGGSLFAAAAIWGFGALAVAAFRAGRGAGDEPEAVPAGAPATAALPSTTPPPIPPAP